MTVSENPDVPVAEAASNTEVALASSSGGANIGRLSLPGLLDPELWDLPGWNGSQLPAAQSSETLGRLDISLALLARYRNSLRPFYRLSPDILVLIFLEIQADYWDPYLPSFGSYAFMAVSKVCHSWREVVIGSPILWKQLSTRYPTAALVALERSVDAGFCLVIPEVSEGERVPSVLGAIASHVNRLRWLYLPSDTLKSSDDQIHQMLLPLIRSPAPLLETLNTAKIRGVGGCAPLPTLFAGQTPSLTRLHIDYMWPQLGSITLKNLKSLGFNGKKRNPIQMSVSALLDLLEACPLLESFKAEKVNWLPATEGDERKVQLPHLRSIQTRRANASITADILGRLITPECSLRLKVWLDRYEDSKFHIGVPPEHELEFTHYLHDIKKMHVHFLSGYEGVAIYGATKTLPFEINGLVSQGTLDNLGDMDAIAGTVFQSIVKAFDLENLEEFSVTEMRNNSRWTGFTKKVWTDTFRRMPNLKSFHITMDSCYDEGFSRSILAALSSPDDRTGRWLCPSLENVFVFGDKTWSSLQCYTMAEERAKAGHALKRVSMRLPHYASFDNPDDTDLPLLRRFVEKVDLEPVDIVFPDFPPDTL
ncbi:hypothetical protein PHLCEN_2v5892 [Hermanssonia centrifuga]|uniref:F-box domain-containing protein n=1 Tax=Hermanssonia centrifuga TaxID=98765 RepID=A0A2R6P153_9APHY|nr:hypothetical protein PHLCEN_2v5892 [Hermanssonia centrifuga]